MGTVGLDRGVTPVPTCHAHTHMHTCAHMCTHICTHACTHHSLEPCVRNAKAKSGRGRRAPVKPEVRCVGAAARRKARASTCPQPAGSRHRPPGGWVDSAAPGTAGCGRRAPRPRAGVLQALGHPAAHAAGPGAAPARLSEAVTQLPQPRPLCLLRTQLAPVLGVTDVALPRLSRGQPLGSVST